MRDLSVADLMNDSDVVTANPLLSAASAARLMTRCRVGALVVLDDGEVTGIFTERDLMTKVVAAGLDPERTPLAEVMTPDPRTVGPDDDVELAVSWMVSGRHRHLPVLEDGHLAGIISQGDVLAYLRGEWHGAASA